VLAPGKSDQPVQFIDVRDLAEFTVTLIENRRTGAFNALGPERPLSMSAMLEACKTAAGSDARFVWVDQDFLVYSQRVAPWSEMPLWIPDTPDDAGFARTSNAKAIAAGLRFRPIVETARDTLAWIRTLPVDRPWKAGISAERERNILEAYRKAIISP